MYTVIRYHIFKGVDWEWLPLYTTNKIAAWSALIFTGMAISLRDRLQASLRRLAGLYGFYLAVVHVVISNYLVKPAYFPSFFTGATLNLVAGTTLLTGITGFALMLRYQFMRLDPVETGNKNLMKYKLTLALMALMVLHTTVLGIHNWWPPSKWPGYMPPISGLTALTSAVFLYMTWAGSGHSEK